MTSNWNVIGRKRYSLKGYAPLRPPQLAAVDAALSADNGVILLPCGVGKTAVALSILVNSGACRTVIMTCSTRAAYQLQDELLRHTNISKSRVWVMAADDGENADSWDSGVARKRADFSSKQTNFVLIMPYTLFPTDSNRSSEATRRLRSEINKADIELLILDEAHIASAKGKRQVVGELIQGDAEKNINPIKRRYALTATPFREAVGGMGVHTEDDGEEGGSNSIDFDFIGPALYHSKIADAQKDGIIAKMNHHLVSCFLPGSWFNYLTLVTNSTVKNDVVCLPPQKIEIAAKIVRMHLHEGRRSIIFVEKILAAKLILDSGFFPYFAIVCGENPAADNDAILRVFSAGDNGAEVAETLPPALVDKHGLDGGLNGIITTRSGDTATNFTDESICVGIRLDHQGCSRRGALQRDGRLCRSPDAWPFQDEMAADKGPYLAEHGSLVGFEEKWAARESLDAARARRLASQKEAWIYNLVTQDTREYQAAVHVENLMVEEGYRAATAEGLDQATDDGLTIVHVGAIELEQHIDSILKPKGEDVVTTYKIAHADSERLLDSLAGRHTLSRIKKIVSLAVAELRKQHTLNEGSEKRAISKIKSKIMRDRRSKSFEQNKAARKRLRADSIRQLREGLIRQEMAGASAAAIQDMIEDESF
jgi:superfamily II DNA or RNA helicase